MAWSGGRPRAVLRLPGALTAVPFTAVPACAVLGAPVAFFGGVPPGFSGCAEQTPRVPRFPVPGDFLEGVGDFILGDRDGLGNVAYLAAQPLGISFPLVNALFGQLARQAADERAPPCAPRGSGRPMSAGLRRRLAEHRPDTFHPLPVGGSSSPVQCCLFPVLLLVADPGGRGPFMLPADLLMHVSRATESVDAGRQRPLDASPGDSQLVLGCRQPFARRGQPSPAFAFLPHVFPPSGPAGKTITDRLWAVRWRLRRLLHLCHMPTNLPPSPPEASGQRSVHEAGFCSAPGPGGVAPRVCSAAGVSR